MPPVIDRRMTVELEGDFVVFLIGMRINAPLRVRQWAPVLTAMPRMVRELERDPSSGFLGARWLLEGPRLPTLIQYWRSFEQLEAYSRSRESAHWPAWVAFNRRIGSSGVVGIWHETYLVPAGGFECVYNNMPPIGLGTVGTLVPAAGRKAAAASRAGRGDTTYPTDALTDSITT